MGSLMSRNKHEDMETPGKESILKRIEDPRSPTEEINRTPLEVMDKVSKDDIRHLAYSNALKSQNCEFSDSSPLFRKMENSERNIKKPKYPFAKVLERTHNLEDEECSFAKTLERTPILDDEESNDVSAIEKENVL